MANGKIYLDQSNLKITAETGVTVTGAIAQVIKFIKPDNSTGEWDATISGTEDIFYEFSEPSELDQSGDWTFWAFVTFSDGRKAPGEPVTIRVYEEGN